MKAEKSNPKEAPSHALIGNGKTRPIKTYVRDGQRFTISPFTSKEEAFTLDEFRVESKKARTRILPHAVAS
jgi:hypothetical protein